MTNSLRVTLACEAYDRTNALRTGEVAVAGVDLNYLCLPVEETFHRMVRFQEFDVSELSLSSYVLTLNDPNPPFVAIPVYPSRTFRHSGIYVNAGSGISQPSDLIGARVGIPEYQVTAAVWIRGILADQYGVPVNSVRYRTGGLHSPGRTEKLALSLPEDVEVVPIDAHQTLNDMLVSGEIDALYSPRTPDALSSGNPAVRRLFTDVRATEEQYFESTGIFPIMHVVAIRRELYESNRWLAKSLYEAFVASRDVAMRGIDETASLRYMLPWLPHEVARTRAVMGDDFWRYGLNPDDPTLAQFLSYSHAQGLANRLWEPSELFAPESLEQVVV